MSTLPDLIPEATLQRLDDELQSRLSDSARTPVSGEEDGPASVAMRYFLLFSQWPELLGTVALAPTAPALLYNRYYWFLRLKHLRTRQHGADAGMEQQAFQLLEGTDCDVDWSVIEAIEQQVDVEMWDTEAG